MTCLNTAVCACAKKWHRKLDESDGLKLKVEANLDVEIELKASIRGDLTLSL